MKGQGNIWWQFRGRGLPNGQPEEGGDGPLQLEEGVQRGGRGADQPGDVVAHAPPNYQHSEHNYH